MTRNKFWVIIAGSIFVVLAAIYIWQGGRAPAGKFAGELPPSIFDVQEIRLTGRGGVYALRQGRVFLGAVEVSTSSPERQRVLALANFREMNLADPILFSRSLDPERLSSAVRNLAEEEKGLFRALGFTHPLLPLDFLKAYAEATRVWMEFDKDVSEDAAEKLMAAQRSALAAYRNDTEELAFKIKGLKAGAGTILATADYVSLGGETFTNLDIISADLALMLRNAEALEAEIARREKCFKRTVDCTGRSLPPVSAEAEEAAGINLFSKGQLGLGDDAEGVFEVSSACWKLDGPAHVYAYTKCPESLGYCFADSQLADKMYFTKLGDYYPYDIFLRSKGIQAIPQNATTPYECNNLEYYAELNLLAAGGYLAHAEVLGLYATEGMQDDIKELEEAEKEFFGSGSSSFGALARLGAAYGKVYSGLRLTHPAAASLALQEHIRIAEKMTDFDQSANRIAGYLRNFRESFAQKGGRPMEGYVYAIRNGYSYLFLNFSPTTWRLKDRPRYLERYEGRQEEINSVMDFGTAKAVYGEKNLYGWAELSRSYDKFEFYAGGSR